MKICVLVPVYKEPKRAGDIAAKILANGHPDTELVLIVDGETNPAIEAALEPYRDRITVHYNHEQLGKTESLNRVASKKITDVFLMLDNDVELPDDARYLVKLEQCMNRFDLVEIPKEAIHGAFVSRMMALEFLSFAMISSTMAKFARRSPSMNGAAFAVRALLFRQLDGFRAVINEDMDFAARAFRLHASFGYPIELKVRNEVPDTLNAWIVQRKRWAMNNVLWIKENFFLILTHFFRTPALLFSTVLMFLPFITYLAVFILVKRFRLTLLLPLVFMVSQHFHVLAGLLLWTSQLQLLSTGGLIATGAGFLVASLVFFVFSRYLRFRFNPAEFLVYYFVYSPVWLAANVIMFFVVFFGFDVKIDWKITPS